MQEVMTIFGLGEKVLRGGNITREEASKLADISEENAEQLRDRVAEVFGSCDVELQYGGQPIYYYIVSAE